MALPMVLLLVPLTVELLVPLMAKSMLAWQLLEQPMVLIKVLALIMVLRVVPPSEWMLECPSVEETSADLSVMVLVDRALSSVPRLQQNSI